MVTTIYHGTPLTPRAALKAVLPMRGACVSFYRPDDVEAVEAVSPTIMFRQWGILRMDGRDARGRRVVRQGRLDPVLPLAARAAVSAGPVGCCARCAWRAFPAQRRASQRLAVRAFEGLPSLAHGRAIGAPWPLVRAIRSRGSGVDRASENRACGMPSLSGAYGRGVGIARQSLATDSYDARREGRGRLSIPQRRQYVARAKWASL